MTGYFMTKDIHQQVFQNAFYKEAEKRTGLNREQLQTLVTFLGINN